MSQCSRSRVVNNELDELFCDDVDSFIISCGKIKRIIKIYRVIPVNHATYDINLILRLMLKNSHV